MNQFILLIIIIYNYKTIWLISTYLITYIYIYSRNLIINSKNDIYLLKKKKMICFYIISIILV